MAGDKVEYTDELDLLFDDYLKTDPDIQRAMREFVEQRKRDINEDCERAGLPRPYLLDGEEIIMSWSVSAEVTKENAVDEIVKMEPTYELGEGAKKQLGLAKGCASNLITLGGLEGETFGVSLSGHSQADSPGSAPDSISISIYART